MDQEEKMELLETAKEYVPNLIEGITFSVEQLREDNVNEALKTLQLVMDGLSWCATAITNLVPDISLQEINEQIKEVVEAIENQDYVYLSDLLEYEIMKIVEEWESLLNS